MLDDGNIYLVDYAIKNMPDNGIIMKIDCYGGLSTNLILYLLNKNNINTQLIGCDAWTYEGFMGHLGVIENYIDGRKDINREKYMEHIKKSFISSTQFLHHDTLPFTCHLTYDDFFEKWNKKEAFFDVFNRSFELKEKLSFCYIDGDHSYVQTKKDYKFIDSNPNYLFQKIK
jgi:dimeric dUTPase (all-alpha-NTP-PPase superfamily)